MTLDRSDFAAFFAAVRDGQRSFAWQQRLLDHLLEHGRWPERIAAPTGTGKTAVVDVHVFGCALGGWGAAPRLPRRLSVVVDRRVVVDSHDEHAQRLRDRLLHDTAGVLAEVAEGLRRLRPEADRAAEPLLTARLRGGSPPPRSWRDQPEACQVLVATPDMWGSRLLLAGYGSSRPAWPREAGLLALDSVLVVDEAHLSRQLLLTARRVGELIVACQLPLPIPGLQVVETTATPATGPTASTVGVKAADLLGDRVLTARLTRPKPVTLLPLPWPIAPHGPARLRTLALLADHVEQLRRDAGPTIGCVVNRVATAVDLTSELRRRGLAVELLVGRLRPADITRLRARRPALLSIDGDPAVDVLVATQTVEVGVDLDFSALVTELASGAALTQRAGRVNRVGRRARGPIVVAVPELALPEQADTAPYTIEDITAALRWLRGVAEPTDGMSPWRLAQQPAPNQTPRRTLLQRPELADSWQWANTSEELFAEPDRQLWLADDLAADLDVGIVVRRGLPADLTEAGPLLRECPPRAHETFPTRIRDARRLLERDEPPSPVYRWRAGELDASQDLRPGDVLVLSDDALLLRGGVIDAEGTQPADDVFEEAARDATLRLGAASTLDPAQLADPGPLERLLNEAADVQAWTRQAKRDLAAALDTLVVPTGLSARVRAAASLLRQARTAHSEVLLFTVTVGGDERISLVIADRRRVVADEDLRQTWTSAEEPVPLARHQQAVADRARESAASLGLGPELGRALELAGLHHDDGKADPRFQAVLGADGEVLAKSARRGVRADREARASSPLPAGWRHEQLSALLAWQVLQSAPLALRLVGTSHGHGRTGFPHTCSGLLPAHDPHGQRAKDLFDLGDWDALVEATDRVYGVWGCAYLEAVLRAADGRVSREGS